MKVIDLFKNNSSKVIVEYHGGIARGFESFEKYAEYLDSYYGDAIVQKIIFNELKESINSNQNKIYYHDFEIRDDINKVYQSHCFTYRIQER